METITIQDLRQSKNDDFMLIITEPFIGSDGVKHLSQMTPVSKKDIETLSLEVGDKVAVKF